MNRDRFGRTLMVLGAVIAISGSLIIEIAVILLLTPIAVGTLATAVKIGIGVAVTGAALLFIGNRWRKT